MQTLLTAQPMDRLLFRKQGSRVRWLTWLADAICVVPLQLAWGLRILLTPTLAMLGTAMVVGNAESAVDIVLNSVAVGFIFELDDVMYTMLLGSRARHRYANAPPEKGTCLAVPGSPLVAEWYSWLLVAGDFGIAMVCYVKYAFAFTWEEGFHMYGLWQFATGVWLRAGVLAAANIHLAYRARAHKVTAYARRLSGSWGAQTWNSKRGEGEETATPTRWRTLAQQALKLSFEFGRVVISAGIVLAVSAVITKVFYQYAYKRLGYSVGCVAYGSELDICLQSFTKSSACSNGVLNWTAPGNDILTMDYSYEDEFWSMQDFGPVRLGCLPKLREADAAAGV